MKYAIMPALLLVAACNGDAATAPADGMKTADHSEHMGGTVKNEMNEAQRAYSEVNDRMHGAMADIPADPDVAFMVGMLAHHRGAVEMSEVLLEHGSDPETRDLAQRIINAQAAEIEEMETWLQARDGE